MKIISNSLLAIILMIFGLSGCDPGYDETSSESAASRAIPAGEMQNVLLGAGASFPAPIYRTWISAFSTEFETSIDYQSVGSSMGVLSIKKGTVDFAGTDAPVKPVFLGPLNAIQFPVLVGGITPVVNIAGIDDGALKLTPDLLVRIFMGEITRWNDSALMDTNPHLSLPDIPIKVVHRKEGSGTTAIFTAYLSQISSKWDETIGSGKEVHWPVGIGKLGNAGVAEHVKITGGAIGYVEYAFAKNKSLAAVQLLNKAGFFVRPSFYTFESAAGNAEWDATAGFNAQLLNKPGTSTWPITGATFVLMPKKQTANTQKNLSFFNWCFENGNQMAKDLNYVPLPAAVQQEIRTLWKNTFKDSF